MVPTSDLEHIWVSEGGGRVAMVAMIARVAMYLSIVYVMVMVGRGSSASFESFHNPFNAEETRWWVDRGAQQC